MRYILGVSTATDKRLAARRAGGSTAAMERALRDASLRLSVPVERLRTSVAAARMGAGAFRVVEALVDVQDRVAPKRLARAGASIASVLESVASTGGDPLAAVDDASLEQVVAGHLEAELDARRLREQLLAASIGIEEAALLVGRSRQALERRRRAGELLALPLGRQWRYPRWQFDPNAPGGIVAGLGAVLDKLRLTPLGAAVWLTTPSEALGGRAAIDLLAQGLTEPVLGLADERAHMP